ncbi:hypothetical protein GMOD_00003654 [Pyrenophora seminiperda CCB06]|uniref:Uncharacterized protein n=1 Tax=Pyrenophora seminiperda CCB06 TaxID=1302712 RepID=A0A3M7MJ70_9PLEO|nr:hypothetical protein GMOD_00003654 [Pyrenophora seminiperda CCB06]
MVTPCVRLVDSLHRDYTEDAIEQHTMTLLLCGLSFNF